MGSIGPLGISERTTFTFREFSKRRNDLKRLWATRLLLLLTNPRSPQSSAEATEDGGPSRVFRRQQIPLGHDAAI
jgi:hypothetical protein